MDTIKTNYSETMAVWQYKYKKIRCMVMYHVMRCLNFHMVQEWGRDLYASRTTPMPFAHIIGE